MSLQVWEALVESLFMLSYVSLTLVFSLPWLDQGRHLSFIFNFLFLCWVWLKHSGKYAVFRGIDIKWCYHCWGQVPESCAQTRDQKSVLNLPSFSTSGIILVEASFCVCVCVGGGAQSCLTLCDPMDYKPPSSSVHGISQARILELVAISYSRGSSQSRDRTHVSFISCIGKWILYHRTTWEAS